MLSRDCHGCPKTRECKIRFVNVKKGEFVYCPDGARNLVDCEEICL
jgi:hypothetical protein